MTRHPNLPVDVEITVQKTLDARDEPTVLIALHDRLSSTTIAEVKLTAGQLVGALSGSYLSDLEAWVTPAFDRIGKKMVHRTVDVPREVIDGLPYRGEEREAAARAWGRAQAQPEETVETRNTNQGWKIIFRSYVEA